MRWMAIDATQICTRCAQCLVCLCVSLSKFENDDTEQRMVPCVGGEVVSILQIAITKYVKCFEGTQCCLRLQIPLQEEESRSELTPAAHPGTAATKVSVPQIAHLAGSH